MGKLNFKKSVLLLLTISTLISCEKNNEIVVNQANLLLGNWIHPEYDNETITFQRANSLQENTYGISFKEKDVFIERTSGWCGTPPLSFFDVEGTWEVKEDALVKISKTSFPENFQWRVLEVSETKLVVKTALTAQEIDHQKLMTLFDEVYELANSVSCTNSSDWNFTAYGSKACGGPQGFIAYSNEIDTVAFLNAVDVYTEAEHQYNIKWSIFSTCDIPQQPTSVECQNGYPVLNY